MWYYNPQRKIGVCNKLMRPWSGPYKVIRRLNDVLFMIQDGPRKKPRVVHHDKLKPYEGRVVSTWFNEKGNIQ